MITRAILSKGAPTLYCAIASLIGLKVYVFDTLYIVHSISWYGTYNLTNKIVFVFVYGLGYTQVT